MARMKVHNGSSTSLVVDDTDGRTLDPGETRTVEDTPRVQSLLAQGYLVDKTARRSRTEKDGDK